MGRLIDIDSLKGCAIIRQTSHEDIEHIKACKCCISHDDIPTPYNVDAVVAELCKEANDTTVDFCNGVFVNVESAIDIVRKGGVE